MSSKTGLTVEHMERQLDRLAAFYPRIDSKVSAILAVTSGQLAIASLNLTFSDFRLWYVDVPLTLFVGCAVYVFAYLYKCTYPHLEGGHSSMIYFAEIAKKREHQYIAEISNLSLDDFATDLAGQIWRNAEIVCVKYRYLKKATIGLCLSILPWSLVLLGTSLIHWRMLSVGK